MTLKFTQLVLLKISKDEFSLSSWEILNIPALDRYILMKGNPDEEISEKY